MDTAIICIGNKARGDDGAARYVAELLQDPAGGFELPTGTLVISKPQLDVVMAEDVSRARRVVFVDAERRDDPPVRVETLEAGVTGTHAHAIDPAGLLALCETLYAATPKARLVSIAGPEMPHHEGLSDSARAASEEAARVVADIVQKRSS